MPTAWIALESVKDSDGWEELANNLGLSEETKKKYFKYGEFANIEIEVDEHLNIVGGRLFPTKAGK